MTSNFLSKTALLDHDMPIIKSLIAKRGWESLTNYDKILHAYDFVRNEILFGYNAEDTLPASRVLADGYGQCNTKGTLLMAILRALGVPCRFHGFTIDKRLQRGVVPELVYPLAPRNIIHSWVEINFDGQWLELEGFIIDQEILLALQNKFPNRNELCAYGVGTKSLQKPNVEWHGKNTYIQKTGINQDYGVFENPDDFYVDHRQLSGVRGLLYRFVIRHWMNYRVKQMRNGAVPTIPGGPANLEPPIATLQIAETV